MPKYEDKAVAHLRQPGNEHFYIVTDTFHRLRGDGGRILEVERVSHTIGGDQLIAYREILAI
ncbi:MAG TPA: hypothetical protein VKU19_06735 [Bryobacteraceae bacterium]|nr:hypothetical protein [Bryobacteraceae bacterium]